MDLFGTGNSGSKPPPESIQRMSRYDQGNPGTKTPDSIQRFQRSQSALELRKAPSLTRSGSDVGFNDSIFSLKDDASTASPRGACRKSSPYSNRMWNGDDVRQALTHNVQWNSAWRIKQTSASPVRIPRSLSHNEHDVTTAGQIDSTSFSRSAKGGLFPTDERGPLPSPTGDHTPQTPSRWSPRQRVPKGSPRPSPSPARSPVGRMSRSPSASRVSDSGRTTPAASPARSPRSTATNHSGDLFVSRGSSSRRASGTPAPSFCSDIGSTTRSRTSYATSGSFSTELRRKRSASEYSDRSPRWAEDHLWRELFHEELDEQKVPRLREQGKAIGGRGRSSAGIPWRQIPVYDRMGSMYECGDPYGDFDSSRKHAIGMQGKKHGSYSPRHRGQHANSGEGARDRLSMGLAPVSENAENSPPASLTSSNLKENLQSSSAREAWLDVVKRRMDAKRNASDETGFRQHTLPVRDPRQGFSLNGTQDAGEVQHGLKARNLHWTWRHSRKSVSFQELPSAERANLIKDSCPYSRDDSTVPSQPAASPKSRRALQPPATLTSELGDCDPPLDHFVAQKHSEARRDWQYHQDQREMDAMSSTAGSLSDFMPVSRSPDKRKVSNQSPSKSSSNASLPGGGPTMRHRAFASHGSGRPRWK
mmetsp:Transcript_140069/g.254698  ORF Transcript_140069/g.254698 Transcript_140069/m.254698 type:complete len:647 (+) Transcript_140069:60-2000(+)